MENIFLYDKKIGPYRLVALLYEKIYGGIICKEDLFCPLGTSNTHIGKILKQNKVNKKQIEQFIIDYIGNNNLNNAFCKKLKISKELRYLLCIGFHECYVCDVKSDINNLSLKLDIENSLGQPNLEKNIIILSFSNFNQNENFSEIKNLYIDDFRIDFIENKINVYLCCQNRGFVLIKKEVTIICENITMV